MMFVYLVALSGVLLSGLIATAQDPGAGQTETIKTPSTLTVGQAVEEALQNNLNLLAERVNLTIAETSLITARLRPNPVLSLGASHQDLLGTGFSRQNGAGPPEFSGRVDVPMERGDKRQLRIDTANYVKEVAEVQLLESIRKLTLEVALTCIDLLQAKANLALAIDNLRTLEEVVRLNEVKVKDGAIAPVELTRSRVAMLQYRSNVKRAELELATARTKLQNLLGRTTTQDEIDIRGELKVLL